MKYSRFAHAEDKHPQAVEQTWFAFCQSRLLESHVIRHPSRKTETPAISPASYPPGASRLNVNVLAWSFLAYDYDAGVLPFDAMVDMLDGFNYCLASTTQSTAAVNRWRLYLPLAEPLERALCRVAWHAGNRLFGRVFDGSGDESRLSFIPAAWQGSDCRFVWRVNGTDFPVYQVIEQFPEAVQDCQPKAKAAGTIVHHAGEQRLEPIFPDWMIRDYETRERGGRFFLLLCRGAARCVDYGWDVTARELSTEALALVGNDPKHPGRRRENPDDEAVRALSWACDNVRRKSGWERAKKSIEWSLFLKGKRSI